MWSLDGDKASGPDGFALTFSKVCYDVIHVDLMLVMQDFFDRGFLDKGSNTTYISPIPKKEGAKRISDFCHISSVESTYKIISKYFASRLIEVLPGIVSKEQGAFLKGRNMVDRVLCANEYIDARLRQGRPEVVVKLDLEKAYDHVNWEFLHYILRRHDFRVWWREWIWKCVSLTSFSVLVNGVSFGNFGCSKGLHQGDPLSLLLFLLVAGVLGGLHGKAAGLGMFEGFSPGGEDIMVSHLQFADETITFCDNSQCQIRLLKCIQRCFEAVSGLKLNLAKSSLIAIGYVLNLDLLATDLGCRTGGPSWRCPWEPLSKRKKYGI